MKRLGFALFGLAAYTIFLATFLYLVAFVAGVPIIPHSIDGPQSPVPTGTAILVDLGLVAIFGLQHSGMARTGFKTFWTRFMPEPIERSGYMIFACLALILIFALWQPLPTMLWDVRGTFAEPLLWAVFASGWAIVLLSTFLISHFELFGLKQVWSHWRGVPAGAPRFYQPFFYKLVRHPLYSGFIIAFWATPAMSHGHLLFAAAMTTYMLIAIEFEERDLVRLFGAEYETYRTKVGKLAPRLR
jgi:protein-S-isoprenylcysteine O-methyltransferase Ste14